MTDSDIYNLKEEDLTYFGFRVEPYFASHIILMGMLDMEKIQRIFDWNTGVRWFQYNYEFFQLKNDLTTLENELRTKFNSEGLPYVRDVVNQCIEAGDRLIEASKRLGEEATLVDDKEKLSHLLQEYYKVMTNYTPFYSLAMFEKPVFEIAESLAEKYSHKTDKDTLFNLITLPARETAVEREQRAFLELAQRGISNGQQVVDHAKKFGWLSIRFFIGDPWSAGDVEFRLATMSSTKAQDELEKRTTDLREREQRLTGVLEEFTEEDKNAVSLVREIVFLRNQRADYYNESAYHIRPLLMNIAKALDVIYDDLLNLTATEIIQSLSGDFEYRAHIAARKADFFVYHNGEQTSILEGREAAEFIEQKPFLQTKVSPTQEISGKVGHPGKIRGQVKIVRTNADIKKVVKGDILVAPMTVPNFLPAMERAAAFVTDEGGITCHAAIVARELRKPCIIGTKIATKVLKDGDEVEVNAETGIVRIIKKAGS